MRIDGGDRVKRNYWWGANAENGASTRTGACWSQDAQNVRVGRKGRVSLALFLTPSLSFSLFLHFFRSFISLAHSSWKGREREVDGGVRAGLLRGETLPRRSVVSDQTAGQCEPSWAVSSSTNSSTAVHSWTRRNNQHLGKPGIASEMDLPNLLDDHGSLRSYRTHNEEEFQREFPGRYSSRGVRTSIIEEYSDRSGRLKLEFLSARLVTRFDANG